ncbi:MAG TPA: hypothetical protein VGL38_03950 [bacterium]|jgi:hypothetical protein
MKNHPQLRYAQTVHLEPGYEAALRDLLDGGFPLIRLDDMAKLLSGFLIFQLRNRDILQEKGLRGSIFYPCDYLDNHLANLYPTRLPCSVEVDMGGQTSIRYQWREVVASGTVLSNIRHDSRRLSYTREPDMGAVSTWPFCEGLLESLAVTGTDKDASRVSFVRGGDADRIESSREKLFEVKRSILEEVYQALLRKDAFPLFGRCMAILRDHEMQKEDIDFYMQVELLYDRAVRNNPKASAGVDLRPGGLCSLLDFVSIMDTVLNNVEIGDIWEKLARVWRFVGGDGTFEVSLEWPFDRFVASAGFEAATLFGAVCESVRLKSLRTFADGVESTNFSSRIQVNVYTDPGNLSDLMRAFERSAGSLADLATCAKGREITVSVSQETSSENTPLGPRSPGLYWSGNCSAVNWIRQDGTQPDIWEPFSNEQAAAMRILRAALDNGSLFVSGDYIIEQTGTKKKGMKELFRGHPAWKTLLKGGEAIEGRNKKGQYYLDP